MRTLRRRRVIVPAAVACVVVAVAVGTAWYLLSGERRMGSIVERVLVSRTGLPISVPRAKWDGRRLVLRDVHLRPGPQLGLDVRVREAEIDAGIMALVAPAGRTVSVVARSASITLPEASPSGTSSVESLRTGLLAFLGGDGELNVRVERGDLHTERGTLSFDLTAAKRGPGLTLGLTVAAQGGSEPLRLDVRGAAALGRSLDLAIDVAGSPRLAEVLWPAIWSPPSPVAGRVQVQLAAGGVVSAVGRLAFGASEPSRIATDFTVRYDATSGELSVTRYGLRRGEDVRVAGAARLTGAETARRVSGTVEGDVFGTRISATADYELGTGAFDAAVKADLVDTARARRLGLDVPVQATARTVAARLTGHAGRETTRVRVDATAAHVATALTTKVPTGASVVASLTVVRGTDGFRVDRVEGGKVVLTRDGKPWLTATATSPASAPWPLAVDASVDNLARAAPLLPAAATLTGSARVHGSLASARPLAFRGTLEARVPRARIDAGGPIELSEVILEAPLTIGMRGDPPPGALGVARVVAYGVILENLTAKVRLADDRALLSDLLYTQYGGTGTGWVDATRRPGSPPFQGRFEADNVDLARFVKDSGASVARITGKVRYVATAQYVQGQGVVADARIESTSGGEVSIDAIEGLLGSASVQAESTGILQRTLQNLRAFEYESLEGQLRYRGQAGVVDLSLRGKKRLGIFPAPVEALNFRNVPLALLVRILTKGNTP